MQSYLKSINVITYTNSSAEQKNSISERNLPFLKKYIYLTHYNTFTYIDKIEDFVKSINNTVHSSFKNTILTPNMLHDISDRNFLKEQFVKMFSINKGKIPNSLQSLKLNTYVRIVNTDRSQKLFFKDIKSQIQLKSLK